MMHCILKQQRLTFLATKRDVNSLGPNSNLVSATTYLSRVVDATTQYFASTNQTPRRVAMIVSTFVSPLWLLTPFAAGLGHFFRRARPRPETFLIPETENYFHFETEPKRKFRKMDGTFKKAHRAPRWPYPYVPHTTVPRTSLSTFQEKKCRIPINLFMKISMSPRFKILNLIVGF